MESVKFRKSIHSKEYIALRAFWIKQRQKLGLSQIIIRMVWRVMKVTL